MLGLGLAGAAFWTALGWPVARRTLPAGIPILGIAPLLGWALHTALSAVVLPWIGVGRGAVLGVAGLALVSVWAAEWRWPAVARGTRMPAWMALVAWVVACAPAAGVLPKFAGGEVLLSAPIYDHAKVAIVDVIARLGLPAANPFYATAGSEHLAYYYWWHLAAAELSVASGAGGWTADAALTWFTAFATLLLVGGLGLALARPVVGLLAMLLLAPGSLRPLVGGHWLAPAAGLGGWLDQAAWAPQHLAAAGVLIGAVLLVAGLGEAPGWAGVVALGGLVAAGFGSSAWVGGIVAAIAVPAAALAVAARLPGSERWRFLGRCAVAGVLAVVLVSPLLRDQYAAAAARGGAPVRIAAYPVFGAAGAGRPALDVVGFPLLLLIDFPVIGVLGSVGVARTLRSRAASWQAAVIAAGLVGVAVCWCLRSTIENNDLGWRAMLAPLLAGTPFAAAEAWRWWSAGGWRAAVASVPLLGLVGTGRLLREDWTGVAGASGFRAEAAMWRDVRAAVAPGDRVASDPRLDADLTLWAANIGWALLADRSSCYAGWATAHPFVPMSNVALYATELTFRRVFDGEPASGDLAALTGRLACRYALVTSRSLAWQHDPFAGNAAYHLVAGAAGAWRLYRLKPGAR